MSIRTLKQNAAMICISLVLLASVQPVMAGNILPPLVQLYETELNLLAHPGQTDQVVTLSGTVNEGGPFTMRNFFLMVPGANGENEFLTASYACTDSGDEVHVTINADGEMYSFINFLQTREDVDRFFDRYLDLYQSYYGHGADGEFAGEGKAGSTVGDRMMHFFTWLDEQLLIVEDREYGFARKFAWLRSAAYARFAPHAAGFLRQVSYASEAEVDNAWVKSLTFQDLTIVFEFPILRVFDVEVPVPERNEKESFSLGLVALESDQPMGGGSDWWFDDYFYCWNTTWTGQDCRNCCNDWISNAASFCALIGLANPALGAACMAAAASAYQYCKIGCGLANPLEGRGWLGGF